MNNTIEIINSFKSLTSDYSALIEKYDTTKILEKVHNDFKSLKSDFGRLLMENSELKLEEINEKGRTILEENKKNLEKIMEIDRIQGSKYVKDLDDANKELQTKCNHMKNECMFISNIMKHKETEHELEIKEKDERISKLTRILEETFLRLIGKEGNRYIRVIAHHFAGFEEKLDHIEVVRQEYGLEKIYVVYGCSGQLYKQEPIKNFSIETHNSLISKYGLANSDLRNFIPILDDYPNILFYTNLKGKWSISDFVQTNDDFSVNINDIKKPLIEEFGSLVL